MEGTVSSIENDIVALSGGAIPQEEAEAEAEASMAGGTAPRGEAEPFQEAEASRQRATRVPALRCRCPRWPSACFVGFDLLPTTEQTGTVVWVLHSSKR